jgi:phytoene dehydrogenase-like protein
MPAWSAFSPGRAGLALSSGEELGAEAVVATITARPLADMLPDDALSGRLMRRLHGWRYGLGTFKLDLALAGPVPWGSDEVAQAGVVHVADTLEAQFRASHEAGAGLMPREPSLVVGQHSTHAPPGKHTLYAYTRVPQQADLAEDEMADVVESRLERFAPGFRELVLARSARSPARLEEENPSMVGGDLGGGSYEIDQQLVFRPALEFLRYRTPFRGLYVASSSIHPGGGVHGTCGAGAARAVLEDRSRLRFWREGTKLGVMAGLWSAAASGRGASPRGSLQESFPTRATCRMGFQCGRC